MDALNDVIRLAHRAMEIVPWAGDDQQYFFDVNYRLLSAPETNFSHWDYIEKQEIETYLIRCKQLEGTPWLPPAFMENWKNLLKARDFCDELRQKHEPMPPEIDYPKKEFPIGVDPFYDHRQLKTRPLKQAIREGKTINPWGSMMNESKTIIETCERCIADLDRCIQIKDENAPPVRMSVSEYKEARSRNDLFSFVLQEYNKTERLELYIDE